MKLLLAHPTRRLPVFIGQSADGRYHVIYDNCSLGSYAQAHQAIDDAAGGHTFSPPDGTDPGSLGLSDDIGDCVPAGSLL
ncbi:hypothetical protein ACFPOE_11460 [Caenimonas terrae]|uniref:Uncharacterized protein n=1 Tax=Caenimonas terrae TaxID=696074 RepID=A0ABW0NDY5_9BURK